MKYRIAFLLALALMLTGCVQSPLFTTEFAMTDSTVCIIIMLPDSLNVNSASITVEEGSIKMCYPLVQP